MSEVQIGHDIVAARLRSIDLDKLVVVGDDVGTVPSQASGSWNPLTIRRALARGEPSGCLDHFSSIRLVKVRLGSASRVVSNCQTWLSKKLWSSLTFAALN